MCRGGVVASTLACRSEGLCLHFELGRDLFLDRPAPELTHPQKKKKRAKLVPWGFHRKTKAAS